VAGFVVLFGLVEGMLINILGVSMKCPVSGQFSADFREKKAGHVGSQNEPSINQHQNETYHSSPSFHSDSLLASAHFD